MLESVVPRPVDAPMNRTVSTSVSHGSARRWILYSDGDEAFGASFSERLRRAGYECAWVKTQEEAIEQARIREFDVFISDVISSGDRELEGVCALQSMIFGLPVIILVGNPCLDTAVRSLRCAAVGYLTKPPECSELTRMIAIGVERRRFCRSVQGAMEKMRTWASNLQALEKMNTGIPDAKLLAAATHDLQSIANDLKSVLRGVDTASSAVESELVERERTLTEALGRTVQVLLQTRQNFKSKRLGELREDLSRLLDKSP